MKNPISPTGPFASTSNTQLRLLRVATVAALVGVGGIAMHVAQASTTGADDTAGAPSLFHHQHCDGSPEQLKAHVDKVLTEAGANDVQKQQIETVVTNAITAEHADMKQYHSNLHQLKTLLTADPIDEAAIATLRGQQEQLAQTLSDRATDTAITVFKSLTPDQRAKVGAQIDQMMSAAGGPHHMM